MTNIVADFETYYSKKDSVSVTDQGNTNYFNSADAYILSLTWGSEVVCGTIEEIGPMAEQIAADPTAQCWAANSNFDQGWWDVYYPPTVNPWKCVLDLGRGHQLPGNLAGLSKVALGKEMDKTSRAEMDGVHYEDLSPQKQEDMQQYCLTDTIREKEILDALPPLSTFEDNVAAHTRMLNRRGVNIDLVKVEADKTKLETMRFEAFQAIPWTRSGFKPLSIAAMTNWCATRGIAVPPSTAKTDEDCTEMMSKDPQLNDVIGKMRQFRKANTLLEKVNTLLQRTTPDGVLPMDLIYCGAPHTKRWSSKGFNMQNLDKKPTKINEELSFWSRNWIVAPPGCQFLILDYAQVEPRCLNWLVGNKPMLDAMRDFGYSYYEAYCSFARGWRGAPGTLKIELGPVKYGLLKNECLGLGYGMGYERFIGYAAENGSIITMDQAKPVVDGFRARNKLVVDFWDNLDKLILAASRDKSHELEIMMPTGDMLRYFGLRLKGRGNYEAFKTKGTYSENEKVRRLWGGVATENVTQRMARDVLAHGILALEAAGFPVAFHAHDEVILVVPDTRDPKQLDEIKREASAIMTKAPAWAPDLPLGVDGDFSPCYTKF